MKKLTQALLLLLILFETSSCASEEKKSPSIAPLTGKIVFQRDSYNLTRQEILSGKEFEGDIETVIHNLNDYSQKIISSGGIVKFTASGNKIIISSAGRKGILFYNLAGKLLSTTLCENRPTDFEVTDDESTIYYVDSRMVRRKIEDFYRIMRYDFKTNTHTEIKSFGQDEEVRELNLSPDGKWLTYSIGSSINYEIPNNLFCLNLETNSTQIINPMSSVVGWYSDSYSLLIDTNTNPDGSRMNTPFGVLAKVNIHTKEFQIIMRSINDGYARKLSKDVNWITYHKSLDSGGKAIFIQSISTGEEIQITTPRKLPNGKYSEDSFPDWYQCEHPLID